MSRTRLFWHIYLPYVATIVAASVIVALYSSHMLRRLHYRSTEAALRAGAGMVQMRLRDSGMLLEASNIDPICDGLGESSGYRVTVIRADGVVVGDSERAPASMDNHANRPEIMRAVSEGYGTEVRYSDTLQMNMMYTAVPVKHDGRTVATARTAVSMADVEAAVNELLGRIAGGVAAVVILAGGVAIFLSRRVSRPLEEIRQRAEAVGRGELGRRFESSHIAEINVLANTLNLMADQLNNRISTIARQRDEQGALFSCMIESVVAADTERRVIKMNESARRLFGVDESEVAGKSIMEVVRNTDLLDLVDETLASSSPVEGNIVLPDGDRHLQAHGSPLSDCDREKIGALIVLNDVTRLRKLETMRRDFVANVSHELRTPITSIKGFVETLIDGAAGNQEDRERFLSIINRQADRLQAIVEDLLVLSDLENGTERDQIELRPLQVYTAIEDAVESCRNKAAQKDIKLECGCDDGLRARINVQLLEQAIVNFVDNAVKYSDNGAEVSVSCQKSDSGLVIAVTDSGPGIAQKHLPRIFERFYRVDKGRSRKLGGTGLGLAIVKHIATVHGGRAEVDSKVGKGSTFSIILPLLKD